MSIRNPISHRQSSGISLIEILVALVIGIMLLAGISQVYVSNHAATTMISGFSLQQENARVAMNKITRSLRSAGHYGAVKGDEISVVGSLSISGSGSCDHDWATDTTEPLRGFEGASAVSGVSNLPSGCIDSSHYVANSDILVLRYASAAGATPIASLNSSKVYLRTAIAGGITGGEIFLGGDVSSSQVGGSTDGVGVYNYEYTTELFYLRPCSELNGSSCTDGIHSLVKMSLDGSSFVSETIAEGVEQFQVVYGIDTDADYIADRYSNASSVTDWSQVVSTRFSIVVRSQRSEVNYSDSNTYSLVGNFSYTPGSDVSGHRRKSYTRVVQLRNMSRG